MVVIEPQINSADTLVSPDTTLTEVEPHYGLLLTSPPPVEAAPQRESGSQGVSFILAALFLLVLIISLRFRDNMKYVIAIVHDLITTRIRQNAFDDTVRETSLLVMLNVMWCACAGITGFCVFNNTGIESTGMTQAVGMLAGMAIAGVYTVFMYAAYSTVGWVFSDQLHSRLWVKGFAACQALMAPAFFITALLAICCPLQSQLIGFFAFMVFIAGKLAFILKGYRIFFSQFSSWVLFLCYLCSLEIVPLFLCYRCAVLLG